MKYPFKNLVFEGGGIKGIAYVGALQILHEKGVLAGIERVGGTSAGAINALLLGLNFTLPEVRDIMKTIDFRKFMDDNFGIVRDIKRVVEDYGWYKGDYFYKWVEDLIKSKTGNSCATFADVQQQAVAKNFKDLYFMGTNLSTGYSEIFSNEHTPQMKLADAVRISMSIPLFFAAVVGAKGDVYVDGGVLNNYPIRVFDREKYIDSTNRAAHTFEPSKYKQINEKLKTADGNASPYLFNRESLGFRLDTSEEIEVFQDHAAPERKKIDDFFSYTVSLISTVVSLQDSYHRNSDDWKRTIYIDTLDVKTTQFDISTEKKEELINSGQDHTKKYFDWYDAQNKNDS